VTWAGCKATLPPLHPATQVHERSTAALHEALLSCGTCADRPKLLPELGPVKSQTDDLKGGEEELAAAIILDPENVKLKELLSKAKNARLRTQHSLTVVR